MVRCDVNAACFSGVAASCGAAACRSVHESRSECGGNVNYCDQFTLRPTRPNSTVALGRVGRCELALLYTQRAHCLSLSMRYLNVRKCDGVVVVVVDLVGDGFSLRTQLRPQD